MVNKTDYTVFNINNVFLLYCTDYDLRASIVHEMGKKKSEIFRSTDDLSQRRGKNRDNLNAMIQSQMLYW